MSSLEGRVGCLQRRQQLQMDSETYLLTLTKPVPLSSTMGTSEVILCLANKQSTLVCPGRHGSFSALRQCAGVTSLDFHGTPGLFLLSIFRILD